MNSTARSIATAGLLQTLLCSNQLPTEMAAPKQRLQEAEPWVHPLLFALLFFPWGNPQAELGEKWRMPSCLHGGAGRGFTFLIKTIWRPPWMLTLLPETPCWPSGRLSKKLPIGRSHSARIWGQRSTSVWVTWNFQHLRFCSKTCLPQFESRLPVCPAFAVMMLDLRAAQCPWAALWAAGWASRRCQFSVTQILTVERYFALGYCSQNIICPVPPPKKIKNKQTKQTKKTQQNENIGDTFTWYFSGSWKWEIMNKNVHYKIIHFSPWFTS